MRSILSAAVVLIATTVAPAADPRLVVSDLAGPFRAGKKNLGLVVGVVTPDGRYVFGYGTVKIGPDAVVPDGDTVFELGSVTKAYTGVLLAALERDGVVKLDDLADKHLPAELRLPRWGDRPITLLDLTTHHSGLPVQPPLIGWRALFAGAPDNPYLHYDRGKLAKDLAGLRLERAPGEAYAYSNLGAGMLGHALEHAAKAKSYEDLLVQRVLTPLGLNDTRITLSPAQRRRFSSAHDTDGDPVSHWDFACLEACGGLRSTAHDQLAFLAANLGLTPTPLAPALRAAQTPRRDTDKPVQKIGLGWHVEPLRAGGKATLVWHNGGTGGSRCFVGFVPEAHVGVVVLSNTEHSVDHLAVGVLQWLGEE